MVCHIPPPRRLTMINPIPPPLLPFKETAVDYWRHVKEPRDIFGSWVIVVVDLKSFSADTSNILGAILREENFVADSLGCSDNGR